ncbi:tyrosine-type recombinase/integrase [Streptomyces sp. NPDC059373]
MADVYDRWHKSHPKPGEEQCTEHKSRTRLMVPTTDHGIGKRWQVRYRDLNGAQRKENYENKAAADARAAEVENELRGGTYVDPLAGRVTLARYAQQWLSAVTAGPTTVQRYEGVIRNHIEPHLGRRELRTLNKPSLIQAWVKQLQTAGLGASTINGINDILVSILDAAVEDGLVSRNACRSSAVKLPTQTKKKIVPWSLERIHAVIAGLPKRFQGGGKLGFGCGLRQGELFGFAEDDIDFAGLEIHVNRQIRIVKNKLVFALPKGNRIRSVPMSPGVAKELKVHIKEFPPVAITLPWATPDGEPRTYRLLFTDAKGKAYNRSVFNQGDWKRALVAAGVIPPRTSGSQYFAAAPDDGMHALRHAYASVLLDAGETVKALAEYLGHSDPGFTLRTYTHLMPASAARTRRAIDQALALTGAEGTSQAMCPQCALAA